MLQPPTIHADATGVWCQDSPTRRWGIAWEEIVRLSVGKIDAIDELVTSVELDFEYGEYLELNSSFLGFDDALELICARFGCPSDWKTRVAELGAGQQPIILWQKNVDPRT